MKIDVVIATYNRPKSLKGVVAKLLDSNADLNKIIVIDSSRDENKPIQVMEKVLYVRSSHANQPYQRYLGYRASDADILIFLDDDMELIDNGWMDKIKKAFSEASVVGVAMAFANDNEFLNSKIPKSKFGNPKRPGYFRRILKAFSGHPYLKPGKFWLCGIRGMQPPEGGETQWVHGGAFVAKRSALYKNFNFRLFDLFEEKMGMGEDVLLGYTLSKQGKIVYIPERSFYHNDQKDSTYTMDLESYGRRVAYSRLYLSFEYGRLSNVPKNFVLLHYIWYMLWRFTGMGMNYLIDPSTSRKELIKGYASGINKALKDRKILSSYLEDTRWRRETEIDLK
ncbi:glycosyltransferase family 2 protein [Nitratifractor salsuginis]|uniref:Glycosyl transferase family 2 n=1 Tax=Nitratifractor salsuginis (strain DSM 16511 / JCM 12458 / E9I37-1) TaxID=749222 RepID=E6X1A6_NITSE|nr:glycosyltransferase family 2 protein [Nitratifractor salsuginis]ADV46968.1 glycosyl transferase family 2 [Nitratifractor salsuginis DSM 16511]